MFDLKQAILTENDCYKKGTKITPIGIMVHSTGANNPWLNRYLPDNGDGIIGDGSYTNSNKYGNHWNQSGVSKCVHGFIGKGIDGEVYVYQSLLFDFKGWHSGTGSLGSSKSANNQGYIGFETCEDGLDDEDYFNKCYEKIVEFCAYLCLKFDIPTNMIIDHSEGNKLGIASNHRDITHWFKKFGKTMDMLREDVRVAINEPIKIVTAYKINNPYGSSLAYYDKPKTDGGKWAGTVKESDTILDVLDDTNAAWLYAQKRGTDIKGYFYKKYLVAYEYESQTSTNEEIEKLKAEKTALQQTIQSLVEKIQEFIDSVKEHL